MNIKKINKYILTALIISFSLLQNISFASNSQPKVCAAPSDTMQLYFQFQEDMMNAISNSKVTAKKINASLSTNRYFSQNVLTVPTVVDIAANNIWKDVRTISSVGWSTASILALSVASSFESNSYGLWILGENRAIVRDYKSLLDIETELMDLAYTKSYSIDLNEGYDGDIINRINTVIDTYKANGFLSKDDTTDHIEGNKPLFEIFYMLIKMNSAMKKFLLLNIKTPLENFEGPNYNSTDPTVIKFNKKTIENLTEEYSGARTFGGCDSTAANFKSTISSVKNFGKGLESSANDVSDAMNRLKEVFGGSRSHDLVEVNTDVDNFSAFHINDSSSYSNLKNAKKNSENKAKNADKEEIEQAVKKALQGTSSTSNSSSTAITACFDNAGDDKIKRQLCISKYFDTNYSYNEYFSNELLGDFESIFTGSMNDYTQSNNNASYSDLKDQYIAIKTIIDTIKELCNIAGNSSTYLEGTLLKINAYQCSN